VAVSEYEGWAYDDLESRGDSSLPANWSYYDRTQYRCLSCHLEWRMSGPARPYVTAPDLPAAMAPAERSPDVLHGATPGVEDSTVDLEKHFHRAMIEIYERAKRETGYQPSHFLRMVSEVGGLAAARQLIRADNPSSGFTTLWEKKRLDLTVEALALQEQYRRLFDDEELEMAERRLAEFGRPNP
jgi:hypothetical protein